jgi:predicted TIM-barrel fold metal-dependent hydrolase
MLEYFKKDQHDVKFYEEYIKERLPVNIVDAHTHLNLPEHVTNISEATIKGDWALECGLIMTDEDSVHYYNTLFPDKKVDNIIFPWPLVEADIKGNNEYISSLIAAKDKIGLMTIRPEWTVDYIESVYNKGGFSGFKPYPYFASSVKGAEVSIFDFMPKDHFELADKLNASVLMHLPRAERLSADGNISELRTIVEMYPNIKLVLAHIGRCFNLKPLKEGLAKLGDTLTELYFDTSAVMNPKVLEFAFEHISENRILFGTDFPIFLWHGKREWSETKYFNLAKEDFSWNTHKYPDQEDQYTFFVYQQIKNILDVIYRSGNPEVVTQKVFFDNARKVYKK